MTIWTPPLEGEFIINNLDEYSSDDLINIVHYQKHLSDEIIETIKMMIELSK